MWSRTALKLYMKFFLTMIFALPLSACTSVISPDKVWESPRAKFNFNQICQNVPKMWVLPVVDEARQAAINELNTVEYVELDSVHFEKYTGLSIGSTTNTIAEGLFDQALKWLTENPDDRSYKFCNGRSGKSCVDELVGLSVRPRDSRPYLVRAVVENENTGFFLAKECEDGLHIRHASLSSDAVPPSKLPVVVFLIRPPTKIIATASSAR